MTAQMDETEDRPNRRFGYKRGWRSVIQQDKGVDIPLRLRQLMESDFASDQVKERAKVLLASIVDDRLPVDDFYEARNLIRHNKLFYKKQIRRAELKDRATSHAVFTACQACENLRDRRVEIGSRKERNNVILQIASAIMVLSETQLRLMGGLDDEDQD